MIDELNAGKASFTLTGNQENNMNIADKAQEIVMGDREKVYGDPGKNLNLIADMWSAYLGVEIEATDVCNLMCMLKISRLKNQPDHEDSKVDLIGYTLLHDKVTPKKTTCA